MASAQSKRPKLAASTTTTTSTETTSTSTNTNEYKETVLVLSGDLSSGTIDGNSKSTKTNQQQSDQVNNNNNIARAFGVGDDLSDETSTTDEDDDDDDYDDDEALQVRQALNGGKLTGGGYYSSSGGGASGGNNHMDIQEQLAAAGPAGVAAAAAIATARKRKRPHSFETNPSVRKRQQTRLIRKLRACIDEYTMRVGQQAVVLITMPGKAVHNFKVFGAQPLESVIRTCKHEIMTELEQALLEQAPQQFKEDANKHELPPLVIDGIPTPVEKMTQAQLRAFIPLMLKYSTGRGKPGWGKDTTRPPWWPETLPWANVRSDARDENEKQRISWTTTLRQIVTNCYKYHNRDDLLPTFDENEESLKQQQQQNDQQEQQLLGNGSSSSGGGGNNSRQLRNSNSEHRIQLRSSQRHQQQQQANSQIQQQQQQQQQTGVSEAQVVYSAAPAYATNFVHTITNSDGTVSLIQVDPANAQILTLPDGTQVRAVRLQTLGTDSLCGQQLGELHEAGSLELATTLTGDSVDRQQQQQHLTGGGGGGQINQTAMTVSEASLSADGQIIVTGEDGTQSCYPMSSLVSIPASMYQQFTQAGGQQLSIVTADGTSIPANAVSIHAIQDHQELTEISQQQEQQVNLVEQQQTTLQQNTESQETSNNIKVQTQSSTTADQQQVNKASNEQE